jgi:hypothetical protein
VSAARISILLSAASLILSLDTTVKYVKEDGGSVTWPPATNQALHVKSILLSNIR